MQLTQKEAIAPSGATVRTAGVVQLPHQINKYTEACDREWGDKLPPNKIRDSEGVVHYMHYGVF